jgi:iron complex outermembrane receptor protein
VTFFTQGDASLRGIESHIDFRVMDVIWIEGGLDSVRGSLTDGDSPLPRIPPTRGRFGIRFQRNALQAGVDLSFTNSQTRIFQVDGIGETPTDGYTLAKLFAAYSIARGKTTHTIAMRLENAGNVLYHNHLNYLKDLAPEVGRDFRVTYSVKF